MTLGEHCDEIIRLIDEALGTGTFDQPRPSGPGGAGVPRSAGRRMVAPGIGAGPLSSGAGVAQARRP